VAQGGAGGAGGAGGSGLGGGCYVLVLLARKLALNS